MENLAQFLPLINILGFLILGGAMVFTQWKLGGNKVSVDVIQAYKERVDQLIAQNTILQASQVDQGKQIASLQTDLKNRDTKITELTALIALKDPAQIEYMTQMRKDVGTAIDFIKRSDEREDRIVKLLESKGV